jgi:hypothetical protein
MKESAKANMNLISSAPQNVCPFCCYTTSRVPTSRHEIYRGSTVQPKVPEIALPVFAIISHLYSEYFRRKFRLR